MQLFVSYPEKLDAERSYRERLIRSFTNTEVQPLFARDLVTNQHVLTKVQRLMEDADLSLFDLTGANPNVALELGIAIANHHPFVIATRSDDAAAILDLIGLDQLRYDDEGDLASGLLDLIKRGRTPKRAAPQTPVSIQEFGEIRFGLRHDVAVEGLAELAIAVVPSAREIVDLHDLLMDKYASARTLMRLMDGVANQEQSLDFWSFGTFQVIEHEDHLEIAAGSEDYLLVYKNGAIAYGRAIESVEPVSIRPDTFAEFCSVTIRLAQEIYMEYGYTPRNLNVLATIRPTTSFLLDLSRPNFREQGYRGTPLRRSVPFVLHIPSKPAVVDGKDVPAVTATVSEMRRILRLHADVGSRR
jgi:hypothetical protein